MHISTSFRSQPQVSNCTADGSCIVLFDDVDISANLTEVNSTYEYNSILLLHSSNNETIASVGGVALVFSLSSGGLLNFVATAPARFNGTVEGLMGNFDGDMTNDLVSRGGQMLPNNASDRMIHKYFGVTCKFSLNCSADIFVCHGISISLYMGIYVMGLTLYTL